MEREWVNRDENAKLRERIAVLETNLSAMQANIRSLSEGQSANRVYSERSFNEIKVEIAEMRAELSDLKAVVTAKAVPTDSQKQTQRYVLAIGVLFAVLIIALLLIWVRLGSMGIHL